MHNLYTIFSKILKICKQFGDNLINEKGNIPRPGVVPKFSDIEVIALNLTSEAMGIDSESNLFIRLSEYKDKMPNLIQDASIMTGVKLHQPYATLSVKE